MAGTPKQELDLERWRAVGLALQRTETRLEASEDAILALTAELRLTRERIEQQPLRRVLDLYSQADWKGRVVLSLPLVLALVLGYAAATEQNPAIVLGDLLETTHLCYGGYPHATAAPDAVEAIEADPSPVEPSPDPSPEPAPE